MGDDNTGGCRELDVLGHRFRDAANIIVSVFVGVYIASKATPDTITNAVVNLFLYAIVVYVAVILLETTIVDIMLMPLFYKARETLVEEIASITARVVCGREPSEDDLSNIRRMTATMGGKFKKSKGQNKQ